MKLEEIKLYPDLIKVNEHTVFLNPLTGGYNNLSTLLHIYLNINDLRWVFKIGKPWWSLLVLSAET